MKQKLTKKGLLRKLIDNLVSHRAKIYDSLNHNYQIVLQSSRIENKYAGLLIIDQIIQGIYQSLKTSSHGINPQGSENISNFSLTNNKRDNLRESLQLVFGDNKMSKQSKKFEMAMQANPIIREIDSRFDLIYFNLIIYLLENVPKMYMRVLKSLNSYCLNKRSKFLCTDLVWQVQHFIVSRILKQSLIKENVFSYMLLLQNVKENFKQYQKPYDLRMFIDLWIKQAANSSNKPYNNNNNNNNTKTSALLSQTKTIGRHKQAQINYQKTAGIQQQYSQGNEYQQEQSQTAESRSSEQYLGNLIRIISLYFNTNISTWNSNFLYDVTIDVYDEHEFDSQKIIHFENVIFVIVEKNQLHVQFFRGLFLLLLDYLAYKNSVRGSRVQSAMSLNGEVNEIKWPNSEKKHVKYNALKTLRRWVVNRHVDLNETVAYNCRLLFQSYLNNYSLSDTHYNTDISKQFLKLIRQNLELKSKKIVITTITETIKQQSTESNLRSICVELLRELLGDNQIFMAGQIQLKNLRNSNDRSEIMMDQSEQNGETAMDLIMCMQEWFSKENKLQIIQLVGFVLYCLPVDYFCCGTNIKQDANSVNNSNSNSFNGFNNNNKRISNKSSQNNKATPSTVLTTKNSSQQQSLSQYKIYFLNKMGEFLYSSLATLTQNNEDLVFKLRFTLSLISLLREIYTVKQSITLIWAFYQQLVKKLNKMIYNSEQQLKQNNNLINQYFLLYLIYELAHMLTQSMLIPIQLTKINQKINKTQTITQSIMMGANKTVNKQKQSEVLFMIQNLFNKEQKNICVEKILNEPLGNEKYFIQIIKPKLQRQNYQQTQKILATYFSDTNPQRPRKKISSKQNEFFNNEDFMNNSLSGNFGSKTAVSNSFGRRDSVYMESQNSSFYRQEDKNLKDVLGIINF